MAMQFDKVIDIDGIDSHIACWGRGIDEDVPEEVIICIPGNPGLIGFYYTYADKLHGVSDLPVWVIGHAGHEENEVTGSDGFMKKVKNNDILYNLNDQLKHKISFIKKFTTSSTKIHLVGHSIGAWITMEILKDPELGPRIKTENLLFPTVQKMADTTNGFWINRVARKITPLILFLTYLLYSTPLFLKEWIILLFFYFKGLPRTLLPVTLKYICPSVINNVLYMAYDEMDHVKELDIENFKKNKSLLRIIYNKYDGWAPGAYFNVLKDTLPGLSIEEVAYEHAFVIDASKPVAVLTNGFIVKA